MEQELSIQLVNRSYHGNNAYCLKAQSYHGNNAYCLKAQSSHDRL